MMSHPNRTLAAVSSVAAILLAVGPGILGTAQYDPYVAVLTASLIAVIWYTTFVYESLEWDKKKREVDREEKARALSTGLLAELRSIEGTVRSRFESIDTFNPSDLRHPTLDHALENLDLFQPQTAEAIAITTWYIDTLTTRLRIHREYVETALSEPERVPAGGGPPYPDATRALQYAFSLTVAQMEKLADCLIEEGGVLTEPGMEPGLPEGSPPSLPESVFGTFDLEEHRWRSSG